MINLLIPADLSQNFFNSLNLALMFDAHVPVYVTLLYDSGHNNKDIQLGFGEVVSAYLPSFTHEESNIGYYITNGKVENEFNEMVGPGENYFYISTYHEVHKKAKKHYSPSNTISAIRSLKKNMLVLPTQTLPASFSTILFPVHVLSKVRHKVTTTAKLARMFNAQIVILNTLTSSAEAVKNAASFMPNRFLPILGAKAYLPA
ncbi:MAG: hypothetical protein HC896_09590 [Bacteroidales bacterium]|nr:hypothetical protein [Bacteroidales bacterium]